jgi:FkbM family methyltransferase
LSTTVRAVGYVRASTADARRPGLQPADQRRRIEEFVAGNGWSLVGVRDDLGLDAGAGRRPQLKSILAELDQVDRVVIVSIDRIGGSARRIWQMVERLAGAGVGLVSLQEGVETSASGRDPVRNILAVAASWDANLGSTGAGRWKRESLVSFGFAPKTVVDVGAAEGTPALYGAFPSAQHVMIEPLHEFDDDLARFSTEYRTQRLLTAVGAEPGVARMNVNLDNLLRSSFLLGDANSPSVVEREISLTTLDALREEHDWEPPFGLKMDVEGAEGEVVKGATRFLEETEFIVTEILMRQSLPGGTPPSEIITLLGQRGFEVYDILDAAGSRADILLGRKR